MQLVECWMGGLSGVLNLATGIPCHPSQLVEWGRHGPEVIASWFVFRFVFCDRNHIPRAHA